MDGSVTKGMRFLLSASHEPEMQQFWTSLAQTLEVIGEEPKLIELLHAKLKTAVNVEQFTPFVDTNEQKATTDFTISPFPSPSPSPQTLQRSVPKAMSDKLAGPQIGRTQLNGPKATPKNSVHPIVGGEHIVKIPKRERLSDFEMRSVRDRFEKGPMRKESERLKKKEMCIIPVVSPDSPHRLAWDFYMLSLILYYAVAVPTRVGFDLDAPYKELEHFFTACFMCDILLNFNTALKIKAETFTDRYVIAKDYMRLWFWIDLVACFPFEAIPMDESSESNVDGSRGGIGKLGRLGKIFRLLRIFKLLRLLKLGRIMNRLKQSTRVNPTLMLLMKTLVSMAAILHWTACGYWFIVLAEGEEVRQSVLAGGSEEEWHPPAHILAAGFHDQYAHAFFWGISVTMGVGWDIIPGTQAEVVYSSIMIVVGAMLYITVLGSVTSILSSIGKNNSKKVAQLESVLAFLRRRMVSKDLSKRVQAYYEFTWDEGNFNTDDSKHHLDTLPDSLQIALASEMHKNLLAQIPIFRNLESKAAFYLIKHWQKRVYLPDDIIIDQGVQSETLFLLIRGKVRLCVHSACSSHLFLSDLLPGCFFGENAMLSDGYQQTATAKAVNFSELLCISKQSYRSMVERFQIQGTVEALRAAHRMRVARMRWRIGFAKVRVVVRLARMARQARKVKERKSSHRFSMLVTGSFYQRPQRKKVSLPDTVIEEIGAEEVEDDYDSEEEGKEKDVIEEAQAILAPARARRESIEF